MDELIEKYLTDKLNAEEKVYFLGLLAADPKFKKEFQLTLAALSIAEFSLDADEDVTVPNMLIFDK